MLSKARERQIQTILDRASEARIAPSAGCAVPEGGYERLHWLYLAQLLDHDVRFAVDLPDVGRVFLPELPLRPADRPKDVRWTYTREVDVTIDGSVRRLAIVCDVFNRTVKAAFLDSGEALAGNADGWTIAALAVASALPLDDTTVALDITTTLARRDGRGTGFAVPVDPTGRYTLDRLVQVGVLDETTLGAGFMPSRRLQMVRVGHATGLAESTLSALRTGTLELERIQYGSGVLLALYGNLSRLRGAIYDAFALRFVQRDAADGVLRLLLTDGRVYAMSGCRHELLDVYKPIVDAQCEGRMFRLPASFVQDGWSDDASSRDIAPTEVAELTLVFNA